MIMTVQSVCSFHLPDERRDAEKFGKMNPECEKVDTGMWIHFKKIDKYKCGKLWKDE